MIKGTGLLATAFKHHFERDPNILIFASGVSNSSETDPVAFRREKDLLNNSLQNGKPLVYFSSCALVNPSTNDNPYLSHKRAMEAAVLATSSANLVLRLPQVVGWTSNPNTLTNYLADRIRKGIPFTAWAKAERNLIDVDDIVTIGRALIGSNTPTERTISIASARSLPMPEIVALFERVLGRKALCTVEDKGDPLRIDCQSCLSIAAEAGIDLGNSYAERVITKYYGH